MTTDSVQEFAQLVKKNLAKNGFPGNAVGFSIDKMYEEADKRGFSFNKIRDLLREEQIYSELEGTRVVFSSKDPNSQTKKPTGDEYSPDNRDDLMKAAAEKFEKMSPEEKQKIEDMVKNMDPQMLENMRKQWEAMSPKK